MTARQGETIPYCSNGRLAIIPHTGRGIETVKEGMDTNGLAVYLSRLPVHYQNTGQNEADADNFNHSDGFSQNHDR